MVDVLQAAGNVWQALARTGERFTPFEVRIVSPARAVFSCGNRIPVAPDFAFEDQPQADIVIVPELWMGPDEDIRGRYPSLMDWLRTRYQTGSYIYSACSGSIILAESGLLDGCPATSHWGYQDLFERDYPAIRFNPEPNLVFADVEGRIVTAGGTTSWHDLALHIISCHVSPGEALRIAKVYLLKWHDEGQIPYAALNRNRPHNDAVVKKCEEWLKKHFCDDGAVNHAVAFAALPERTLKRRFKAATGTSLIGYIHNLRIEEAKRLLETTDLPVPVQTAYGAESRAVPTGVSRPADRRQGGRRLGQSGLFRCSRGLMRPGQNRAEKYGNLPPEYRGEARSRSGHSAVSEIGAKDITMNKNPWQDSSGPPDLQAHFDNVLKKMPSRSVQLFLPLLLILAWAIFSSFYTVQPEQQAVVKSFG